MGDELRLEFAGLEDSFEEVKESERRYQEFRMMILGLAAGVLATFPAQLLVEPFHVTDSGHVHYGSRLIANGLPTPGFILSNLFVVVAVLIGSIYVYRYFSGYYDEPTVRIPYDEATDDVYYRIETFLEETAGGLDLDVHTSHHHIVCADENDEIIAEFEFDPGREVMYLTYEPRNRQSTLLVRKIKQRFG